MKTPDKMRTPDEWFLSHVLPNYDEYLADPLCERRARSAAIAAHHFVDIVFEYYKSIEPARIGNAATKKKFSETLGNDDEHRAMAALRDVADASKHHTLDRTRETRMVYMSTDAIAQVEDRLVIKGEWNRDFEPVLSTVVRLWKNWLEH